MLVSGAKIADIRVCCEIISDQLDYLMLLENNMPVNRVPRNQLVLPRLDMAYKWESLR